MSCSSLSLAIPRQPWSVDSAAATSSSSSWLDPFRVVGKRLIQYCIRPCEECRLPAGREITPRRGITNATCDGKPIAAYHHYGLLAAPELVHRKLRAEDLPPSDGRDSLPRAIRGCAFDLFQRADDRRP